MTSEHFGMDLPEDPRLADDASTTEPPHGTAYLVELRLSSGMAADAAVHNFDQSAPVRLDNDYEPVPMSGGEPDDGAFDGSDAGTVVVRCIGDEAVTPADIEALPGVVSVWDDAVIEPFSTIDLETGSSVDAAPAAAPCPYGTCDCDSRTPKGDAAAVRRALAVDRVWGRGLRGDGVVVGVVDGGITASGRPVQNGQTSRRIANVIGGWPTADWGTRADWGQHGNMCATDVQIVSPNVKLYDMRIAGGGNTVGRALSAYQWALDQHRRDGTPHILSNSWGLWNPATNSSYADKPNHPFTRKVVEAVNRGITVLFAAGNCGNSCTPSGKCGGHAGPGKSIWGANGHSSVITVGAVNPRKEFIGYSSTGPAALDPLKPDLCGISHFTGYFRSDSGTSAATPTVAGVAALLKQSKRSARPGEIKHALRSSAADLGGQGWDQFTGFGLAQASAALDRLSVRPTDRVRVGTQFRGRLNARRTTCWFTFNWPAHWNVTWNVVPVTPRRGAPQISWDVQVERASNNRITYWICVKNLTAHPVDVEGRYLVAG
ncbi:MAG: S8 family serine peptidase [Actinomycetota bacterium]